MRRVFALAVLLLGACVDGGGNVPIVHGACPQPRVFTLAELNAQADQERAAHITTDSPVGQLLLNGEALRAASWACLGIPPPKGPTSP